MSLNLSEIVKHGAGIVRLLFLSVFLMTPACILYAEDADSTENYVYLLNSDEIRYNQYVNSEAQLLVGNVIFRHDSMYMYCDSALFFQKRNSFNAYRNVRAEQGDTLFLFGDSLLYDGASRVARVRGGVRLENREMILLTDSLNYDRNSSIGYFFNGGTLLDATSTLTSEYGEYRTESGVTVFRQDVVFENVDYTMYTDTLVYNVDSRKAFFVCPTRIVSEDNTVETDSGWFDTTNRNSVLLDRSRILYSDGEQQMTGDSIVYHNAENQIYGYGNVLINDFSDHIDVQGDYAFYDRNRDSAIVSGNALAIEYSEKDSLFLHADTFKLRSVQKDSTLNRIMMAYNKVKAFRIDLQMICDSMEFQSVDSCLTLYGDPIVWSQSQQILGEVIKAYMNDSTIEWAHVIGQALSVEQVAMDQFNQISGREIKVFFKNGDIDRAEVDGNVNVRYYPYDSDSIVIGLNETAASHMNAAFKARKVDKIVVTGSSEGTLYPMDQIPPGKRELVNFDWFADLRPRDREDVFHWRGKKAEDKLRENVFSRDVPLPTLPVIKGK